VSDAIGFGQGEATRSGSPLRKQVQNFAAHGMAGFCETESFIFLVEKKMRRRECLLLVGRIILPFIFVFLMGLSPLPYDVQKAYQNFQKASTNNTQPVLELSSLQKIVEWYPWRSDLWERLGMTALQVDQYNYAIQSFQQAELGGGLTPGGWIALGDAYLQTGDNQKAITAWETIIKNDGPSEELFQRLEAVYQAMGDYQGVLRTFTEWSSWQPGNARIIYQKGLWLASHQPENGLEVLLQAARLDPGMDSMVKVLQAGINAGHGLNNLAYQLLLTGRAMSSLQEWAPAIEAYNQALQIDPGYADAWALLGDAQQNEGKDGEPAIKQALALNPDSLLAQAIQALYWQQNGDVDKALSLLQLIALQEPQNGIWQMDIAAIMAQKGDLSAALDRYQQAVQLEPSNPVPWRALATFSLNYDYEVHDIGLPAARNAEVLASNDPVNMDLMGQALAAVQDFTTAERFFLLALNLDGEYAPTYLHLGSVYITEGKETIAVQMLKHAVSLAPSQSVGEQAQRILDGLNR